MRRKPPPLARPPEEDYGREILGERPLLAEKRLSPRPPSPRRAVGNRLGCSFGVERPCECGWSPIGLVVVTAADRAAATFAACGGNPSRLHTRAPPLSGEALLGVPPQRIPFSHLAHPPYRPQEKPMAQAISFSCIQLPRPQRSMSAAALSAAVDSTNSQRTAPHFQAEPPMQKQPTQTPAALRERGVWGERRFSQRKRPLPPEFPRSLISP